MKPIASSLLRCALSLALIVASVDSDAECTQQLLAPQGGEVRAGALSIRLGEPDDAVTPSAWQGPFEAGACKFELGIIEQPLVLAMGDLLYVPTYSGSERKLALLDLASCSIRWESAPFSGALKIGPRELELGQQRIALDAQCVPVPKK